MQLLSEVLAARRSQWLAELSGALREARRLMRELDIPEARAEAMELCSQIDALRREIDAMRLRRVGPGSFNLDPEWMESPWHPMDSAAMPTPPPEPGAGWEMPVDV